VSEAWPWLALLGLGAFHGINPGMGWLFAVALGLQERRRSAVWKALPPIAFGHALSVGLVVAVVALLHASVPRWALSWPAAAVLIGFGIYRLVRARHLRWVGMRVGFRDLTLWSFLLA
jgi:threonine/homoserine/homoserine lactone efflux protein